VLFLLLTRRFKGVAAAAAAYLPVAVIMTRAYGLESWKLFSEQQGPMVQFWAGDLRNSSLSGVVYHLLHPLCRDLTMRSTWPVHRIRELPHTAPTPVLWGTVISLALLAILWLACRRVAVSRATVDVPYALFSAASAFLNVWVWEHYYVMLILPLMVLAAVSWRRGVDLARQLVEGRAQGGWRAWAGGFAGWAAIAAVLPAVLAMLNISMWQKQEIYNQYWDAKRAHLPSLGALHAELHFLDLANWLPWALVIVALAIVSAIGARRAGRAPSADEIPLA